MQLFNKTVSEDLVLPNQNNQKMLAIFFTFNAFQRQVANLIAKYTVKNTKAFSLLYQWLFPAIPGEKIVPWYTGEFYLLYQVTHSTFTPIL